jgi:hypothetical protein
VRDHLNLLRTVAGGDDRKLKLLRIERKVTQIQGLREIAPHPLAIVNVALRVDFYYLRKGFPGALLVQY